MNVQYPLPTVQQLEQQHARILRYRWVLLYCQLGLVLVLCVVPAVALYIGTSLLLVLLAALIPVAAVFILSKAYDQTHDQLNAIYALMMEHEQQLRER